MKPTEIGAPTWLHRCQLIIDSAEKYSGRFLAASR